MKLLHPESERTGLIKRDTKIKYRSKTDLSLQAYTLHFSTLVGGKNLGEVKKGVFGSLKSNFGSCIK